MKTILALVVLVSAVPACRAQTPPPQTPAPVPQGTSLESAPLLRRIAEAADGFRDGRDQFVVIDRKNPPYHVLRVVPDRKVADSIAAANRSDTTDYAVYGPYRTVEDPPDVLESADSVDSVIVVTKGGRKTYDGKKYDAVFWSLPAFDKFIAPYLTVTAGAAYAAKQRELYQQNRSPLAHSKDVGHYRSSF